MVSFKRQYWVQSHLTSSLMNFCLDGRTEYTHRIFADDTKLGGVVGRPDGCAALQSDPDGREK